MGSVECACKGCPSCDSWVNTRVQGHTYLSCEQPVSKKLCHYGSLCKKCLEQADARANGGGAGGQDGASASGQPHQAIEAQVQCLLKRVEAQEATIEQLQWHVWWLLAQAQVGWWAGEAVEGQPGGADAASSSHDEESHGPPGGASAAEWQHRPGTNENASPAGAAEPKNVEGWHGQAAGAVAAGASHHQGWHGQPAEASAAEGQHDEGSNRQARGRAAAEPWKGRGSRRSWDWA